MEKSEVDSHSHPRFFLYRHKPLVIQIEYDIQPIVHNHSLSLQADRNPRHVFKRRQRPLNRIFTMGTGHALYLKLHLFHNLSSCLFFAAKRLSLSALSNTDTDESDMAAAPIIGLSSGPPNR